MDANILKIVALVIFAASVGEAVCEFLFMPLIGRLKRWLDAEAVVLVQQWWSALVGVAIAYELGLDVFTLLDGAVLHPWVGWVFTGCVIGRGSNFVHDLLKRQVLENQIRQMDIQEGA